MPYEQNPALWHIKANARHFAYCVRNSSSPYPHAIPEEINKNVEEEYYDCFVDYLQADFGLQMTGDDRWYKADE